jgi:hypothetical protein
MTAISDTIGERPDARMAARRPRDTRAAGTFVYVRATTGNRAYVLRGGGYGTIIESQPSGILVDVIGHGPVIVHASRIQPANREQAFASAGPWPVDSRAALLAHARLPAGRIIPGVLSADPDEDRTANEFLAAERARDARRRADLRARQIEAGSRQC